MVNSVVIAIFLLVGAISFYIFKADITGYSIKQLDEITKSISISEPGNFSLGAGDIQSIYIFGKWVSIIDS